MVGRRRGSQRAGGNAGAGAGGTAGPGSTQPAEDDGGPPTVAVPAVGTTDDWPGETGGAHSTPALTGSASSESVTSGASPSVRREGHFIRRRFLPRTVLGISAMVLAFSVGAGLSGAVLYSYYQYHADQTTSRVNALINGYRHQFALAEGDLQAEEARAKAQIEASLAPLQAAQATPAAEQALVRKLARSLYFVSTSGTAGQASVGAAFVVASNASQSLLLTSYTTVQAATVTPAPPVFVRQGATGPETQVTVRTWDASHDLALIVLPVGNLPAIPVAPSSPATEIGQPVYVLSGLGSAGASISEGSVDDVSSAGLAIDAPVGTAFQGGPVVDTDGQVLAVASRTYAPLGFASTGITYAPPVDSACQKVLNCPGGSIAAST